MEPRKVTKEQPASEQVNRPKSRRQCAFHEAAHAVMCYLVATPVVEAWAREDDGRCVYGDTPSPSSELLIEVAGPRAEALSAPSAENVEWPAHRASAYSRAVEEWGEAEASKRVQGAENRVRELLARQDVWKAIESVAEELQLRDGLDGAAVSAICAHLGLEPL